MLYIDTSVLLVYTLTQSVEKSRYSDTERFFANILTGSLSGATSFYALHEVYVFALDNAPYFPTGAAFGKAALEKILTFRCRFFLFWRATSAHAKPESSRPYATLVTSPTPLPLSPTGVKQSLLTTITSKQSPISSPTRVLAIMSKKTNERFCIRLVSRL